MLFTCKNFAFSDFLRKNKFAPRNGGGGGGMAPASPFPLSPLSSALVIFASAKRLQTTDCVTY